MTITCSSWAAPTRNQCSKREACCHATLRFKTQADLVTWKNDSAVSTSVDNLVSQRSTFCGSPDNAAFSRLMRCELRRACQGCRIYAEVGQTSSGPAAICLDLGKPLYCSRTRCFDELDKYARGAITFFEIGNHGRTGSVDRGGVEALETGSHALARSEYQRSHNVEHRAQSPIQMSAEKYRRWRSSLNQPGQNHAKAN